MPVPARDAEAGLAQTDRLSLGDFDRLSAFIHASVGIKLPRSKHSMVEGRLRRRIAASGAGTYAAYCAQVLDGDSADELTGLLDAVTTNKTDFFREPEHFRVLGETVLPAIATPHRRLKFWSAACSTGCEPYSLAMVASEFGEACRARGVLIPPPMIVATDLSAAVLDAARLGIYPAAVADAVPPALRKRYLRRARNPARDEMRMIAPLRAMVRFGRLNLMDASYDLDRDFDVIFCRNVLIYFDRDGQAGVLRRLCDHLTPGGILALGHSETLAGLDLPVQPIGHTLFRKA